MSGSWSNVETNLIILVEQVSGYSGLFGYAPAPGAGTLVFSVAAAAGTDPYGNQYVAGLGVYDQANALFADYQSAQTLYGVISGGAPDTADAGSIIATNGNSPVDFTSIKVTSPKTAALPNPLAVDFFGGTATAGSGPVLQVADSSGLDAVLKLLGHALIEGAETGSVLVQANAASGQTADLMRLMTNGAYELSVSPAGLVRTAGALVKADPATGAAYTWQTPTLAAGYTNSGNFQFRIDGQDNLVIVGTVVRTSAFTGAGHALLFTLPAGYAPAKGWNLGGIRHSNAGVVYGDTQMLVVQANGDVYHYWGANGLAANDQIDMDVFCPLGNIA